MSSWSAGPFLGFDTETTGVDVTTDRIVTAALVHRDARGTTVRTWIIDPGVEIPAPATAIHGITTERARAPRGPPRRGRWRRSPRSSSRPSSRACRWWRSTPRSTWRSSTTSSPGTGWRRSASGSAGECGPVLDPLVLDRALDRERPGTAQARGPVRRLRRGRAGAPAHGGGRRRRHPRPAGPDGRPLPGPGRRVAGGAARVAGGPAPASGRRPSTPGVATRATPARASGWAGRCRWSRTSRAAGTGLRRTRAGAGARPLRRLSARPA